MWLSDSRVGSNSVVEHGSRRQLRPCVDRRRMSDNVAPQHGGRCGATMWRRRSIRQARNRAIRRPSLSHTRAPHVAAGRHGIASRSRPSRSGGVTSLRCLVGVEFNAPLDTI